MNIEELEKLSDDDKAKLFAARHAMVEVESGMKIGIGTGSTAVWLVRLLAHAYANGLNFRACATSSQTTELAESLGIKIESLDDLGELDKPFPLDLVIDGADEFSPAHNLIKGGGGALLQEKIVAQSAARFIVITDSSKEVSTLGRFPLPVEIVRFAWQTTRARIAWTLETSKIGAGMNFQIKQRMAGDKPFITDEGHYILDLQLESINSHFDLDRDLRYISGVVETGLFLNMADAVIMADSTGIVKSRETGGDWVETRYELAEIADMLPED